MSDQFLPPEILPFGNCLAPREPGIRVSHILMKWEALTSHDPTARRAAPKGRLQSELGLTILIEIKESKHSQESLGPIFQEPLGFFGLMFWTFLHHPKNHEGSSKKEGVDSVFRRVLLDLQSAPVSRSHNS